MALFFYLLQCIPRFHWIPVVVYVSSRDFWVFRILMHLAACTGCIYGWDSYKFVLASSRTYELQIVWWCGVDNVQSPITLTEIRVKHPRGVLVLPTDLVYIHNHQCTPPMRKAQLFTYFHSIGIVRGSGDHQTAARSTWVFFPLEICLNYWKLDLAI